MRLFEGIMNDKVGKYNIPYRVIRSSRRTISVQIAPSGEVLVRCPRRMSNADIRRFVESKSGWIEKHLEKQTAAARLPVFSDGSSCRCLPGRRGKPSRNVSRILHRWWV